MAMGDGQCPIADRQTYLAKLIVVVEIDFSPRLHADDVVLLFEDGCPQTLYRRGNLRPFGSDYLDVSLVIGLGIGSVVLHFGMTQDAFHLMQHARKVVQLLEARFSIHRVQR